MHEIVPVSGTVPNEGISKPSGEARDQGRAAETPAPRPNDPRSALLDNPALREIMGQPFLERRQVLMEQIEIAEDMVRRASERQPQFAARFERTFVMLRWCQPSVVTEAVYRAHVDELLNRIGRNESLKSGTRAEVLTLLCIVGADRGLSGSNLALFAQLFEAVFGQPLPGLKDPEIPKETAKAGELLAELSRRLAQVWRDVTEGEITC
ncbi:MAG: hypothetical protein ACJ8R9_05380 [Steroidobacteraceae bacterium]